MLWNIFDCITDANRASEFEPHVRRASRSQREIRRGPSSVAIALNNLGGLLRDTIREKWRQLNLKITENDNTMPRFQLRNRVNDKGR